MGCYAQTVTGRTQASALGPTLMHEHVLCDLRAPQARDDATGWPPITLGNRFEIDYFQNRHPPNIWLQDDALAAAELQRLRQAGAGTLVELTVGGMAPQPERLAAIARQSGVNIIAGAGYYTDSYLDDSVRALDVGVLAETICSQLHVGAWGTAVKCGIIGEIGCSWPLMDVERRVLQAAAEAQRRTGAAITVHPGRHPDAPMEIAELLISAGADPAHTVLGHMDRTIFDRGRLHALMRRGFVLEWDFFGIETSQYWMAGEDLDLPTDFMRIAIIRDLIDAGHADRIAISHDICTRTRLAGYGGHGYDHIMTHVVPLMQRRGFADSEIDALLVSTPRRLLAFLSEPDDGYSA